jgi:hypothetical protein
VALTKEQKSLLEDLMDCRDDIIDTLANIQTILKTNFPEEYERAIQFYIPQITTALCEDKKWLNRGEYSLQNTIDNLLERCKLTTENQGLKKFL